MAFFLKWRVKRIVKELRIVEREVIEAGAQSMVAGFTAYQAGRTSDPTETLAKTHERFFGARADAARKLAALGMDAVPLLTSIAGDENESEVVREAAREALATLK